MSGIPDRTAYPPPAEPAAPGGEPAVAAGAAAPEPRIDQTIEGRTGAAFEVFEGERILIRDWSGKQTCVMVAFKRDDPDEYLSTANTREGLGSVMLRPGAILVSNRRNWMLRLDQDTVGRHDLLLPACDRRRYLDYYGLPDHANCRDNLAGALAPHGIAEGRIPDPVNLFMHVAILERGDLEIRQPLSESGDEVVFEALTDLIVAVSACPQDQNQTNGFNPTDLLFRVLPNPYRARPETTGEATDETPAGEAAATGEGGTWTDAPGERIGG